MLCECMGRHGEKKLDTQTTQTERMFRLQAHRMDSLEACLEARLEAEGAQSRAALSTMSAEIQSETKNRSADSERMYKSM